MSHPYGRESAIKFLRDLEIQKIYDLAIENKKLVYSTHKSNFRLAKYEDNCEYVLFEGGLNWLETHVPYWERKGEYLRKNLIWYIEGMHDLITDSWEESLGKPA